MRLEKLPDGGIRALAPAKINLYLEVMGRRPDGFHEIDTIIQAVTLYDEIEFRQRDHGEIQLELVNSPGLPAGEENLVFRAAQLLCARLPGPRPPLSIRLKKNIPIGAGLGGGSSDAAATLMALSTLWGMNLAMEEILELASKLGSDVPFFLYGGTARCQGRGERVTSLEDFSEPFHFVLAFPGFQIPTSLIYRELDRLDKFHTSLTSIKSLDTMSQKLVQGGMPSKTLLFNRLELIACKAFPELESFKKEIQKEPFFAVLMSGSGSTIYGVTKNRREAEQIAIRLRKRLGGEIFVAQSERH